MKVLISGGAGLVGRYIAEELLSAGYKVAIGGRNPPSPGFFSQPVSFVPLSLDPAENQSRAFDDAYLFVHAAFNHVAGKYRGGEGDDAAGFRRLNLDGTVPDDNPFKDSAVWSLGHRNPQGLRFRPGTDELWSTEHGPDTQDELNLIVKGGNYGWPSCRGTDKCPSIENYHAAKAEFDRNDTIATSDLIFDDGKAFPQWKGSILFVTLKTGRLYRVTLDGDKVAKSEVLLEQKYGRLRSIAEGPDGAIYISTDNGNDAILRLSPK